MQRRSRNRGAFKRVSPRRGGRDRRRRCLHTCEASCNGKKYRDGQSSSLRTHMGLGHLHPECHNKCPKWKPEFGFDIPHQDDVQTGFPVQEDSQTEFPVQEDSQTEFPVQTDLVDHDNSHTDSPDRDSGQVEELDIIHQDDAQTELPVQEDSQIDLVDHGDSRTDSPDEDSDEVEVLDQLTSLLTLVPQWPVHRSQKVNLLWVLEPTCRTNKKKEAKEHVQWYAIEVEDYTKPFTKASAGPDGILYQYWFPSKSSNDKTYISDWVGLLLPHRAYN
jgi:hypothetical protein